MTTSSRQSVAIERPSHCHDLVTHILAKLKDNLFVAGTVVPSLASNRSTLEPHNVHNADRLSARDAVRVRSGGDARLPAIQIIRLIQGS
jgi:hypothetical protein